MKMIFILALVVTAIVTLTPSSMPAIVGGFFAVSLLLIAVSDYARRPRFRGRSPGKFTPPNTRASPQELDAAATWTYTTFSA
jgi:hypothetical protein